MSTNWSWPSLVAACQLGVFLFFFWCCFSTRLGRRRTLQTYSTRHRSPWGSALLRPHGLGSRSRRRSIRRRRQPTLSRRVSVAHAGSNTGSSLPSWTDSSPSFLPSVCPPHASVSFAPPPPVSAASYAHPQTLLLLLRRWFPGAAGRTGKEGGDLGEGAGRVGGAGVAAVSRTKMCPGHHSPTSVPPTPVPVPGLVAIRNPVHTCSHFKSSNHVCAKSFQDELRNVYR